MPLKDVEAQEESEPLLKEMSARERLAKGPRASFLQLGKHGTEVNTAELTPRTLRDLHDGIHDTMTYSTVNLISWSAFFGNSRAIWVKSELWCMMFRLLLVAVFTGIITVLVVPNPAVMRIAKFTAVSKFLNVIVGLLLGFFLSSSMTRWQCCVNGFMGLLDALRNLHIQFVALGVREKDLIDVLRYGYASAFMLHEQLKADTLEITTSEGNRDLIWQRIGDKPTKLDKTGKTKILKADEIKILRQVSDPPSALWTWIGVLLGGLAQDGWIPPMNSPTYGRLMNLCQEAHAHIREVKVAITVQAPLTYAHTLATLVHINNLLNAITVGVVGGLAIGTALIAHGMHFYKGNGSAIAKSVNIGEASMNDSERDWQNLAVTCMYCFLGPLLYQALLNIGMFIAQPFQSDDAAVPMATLLQQFEIDVCDSRDSVKLMGFKMPYFKEKPPADHR